MGAIMALQHWLGMTRSILDCLRCHCPTLGVKSVGCLTAYRPVWAKALHRSAHVLALACGVRSKWLGS